MELIDIINIHRFMVIEAIHFYILPRLNSFISRDWYAILLLAVYRKSSAFSCYFCYRLDIFCALSCIRKKGNKNGQ